VFTVLGLYLYPLGWHTLPSHANVEACLTGWPNAQPQGRDYTVVLRDTVMCVVVARPLLIERCVGLREGSGVEIPCASAMIFTLLGL